ncbi:hypothetical protein RSOL_432940 [Rhizoctonia solani AG-3 Rhs1AP]|uniref:WHIM1 domain-containing protein n=1 Tax=Rhizoctonia solani AG-3 Rhs1AP TaxID=1086054 RepID=X8JJJ4_9AGAM|nr:hypothetical protein RSOL_432940 [Rhizoctonia solani AG-3 Rhs1AP]
MDVTTSLNTPEPAANEEQQQKAEPPKAATLLEPNADHPSSRWETAYVYAFIVKFTTLRGKDGLESPVDLEEALLFPGPTPVLEQVLARFVLNLRPGSRNTGPNLIARTTQSLLDEFLRTSERSCWWDDVLHRNTDPFLGHEGDVFTLPWETKLQILRQLVDYQLQHSAFIRDIIDTVWGARPAKHRKGAKKEAPPPAAAGFSKKQLLIEPIGQDRTRRRFWTLDDSTRVYVSGNPWKSHCVFYSTSSTREEYMNTVEYLKTTLPKASTGKSTKRSRFEQSHADLVEKLEGTHLEAVDNELTRLERMRKRAEKRNMMIAQAELRTTRTRRQTKRPDYVYDADDFEDDYAEENGERSDEEFNGEAESSHTTPDEDMNDYMPDDEENGRLRRSTRNASKRPRQVEARPTGRRSARLAANDADNSSTRSGDEDMDITNGKVIKRARTETASPLHVDRLSLEGDESKSKSAYAKLEPAPDKKVSKFWFYAIDSPSGGAGSASVDQESTKSSRNGTSRSSMEVEHPGQANGLGLDLGGEFNEE